MIEGEEPKTGGELARNEAIKLTATYLNGLAVAVFAVGGLAPGFSIVAATIAPSRAILVLVVICFPLSAVLHLLGRRWLRSLRE